MSVWIRAGSTSLALVLCAPALMAAENISVKDQGATAELSVAPLDHVEYPMDRPSWVSNEPYFDGDNDTIVVVSAPCETPEESLEELKWMQRAAIATYIARLIEFSGDFDFYPISDEQIDSDLVIRRYAGEVNQGGTTKYEHAVELRFDASKQIEITEAWKNVEVRHRLGAMGALTFVGLVLLICSSAFVGIFCRRVETQ